MCPRDVLFKILATLRSPNKVLILLHRYANDYAEATDDLVGGCGLSPWSPWSLVNSVDPSLVPPGLIFKPLAGSTKAASFKHALMMFRML